MDVSLKSRFRALVCLFALMRVSAIDAVSAQEPLTDPAAPQPAESFEAEEPYVVFVASSDAHTWCGPGKQYYRTEELRRGQELNVYVETEEGWLGVQPPEESFCWLPASAVQKTTDGLMVVRRDETPVWIGTNLGRAAKYLWQVELHAGEEVTVIERVERTGKQGPVVWLKIVPPSGEFRWIHRDDVVDTAEQLVELVAAAANELKPTERPAIAKRDPSIVQAGSIESTMDDVRDRGSVEPDPRTSTRRGTPTASLRAVSAAPNLAPAPGSVGSQDKPQDVPDRPIQFLGNARPEDYRDSGAVVGSGLKQEWNEEGQSVLEGQPLAKLPANGAAAAAAAIAGPIRKVSDVVANFISPPRFVEINGATPQSPSTAIDQRWLVGSTRNQTSGNVPTGAPVGAQSMAMIQGGMIQGGTLPSGMGSGVIPTGALAPLETEPRMIAQASRVVTTAQIARVEDAVVGADLNAATRVLSQLMAEGASADETDPLIRRIQALQSSGDLTQASRCRELLNRANEYRNLAVRRDGATRIQTTNESFARTPANQALMASQSLGAVPPAGMPQPASLPTTGSAPIPASLPPAPQASAVTGYLVQVYSARADRPPYALTDDAGLTVAYVTPYPGVNLRTHLNSRIEVRGNERMLPEMNTPHILVDSVLRR
ncbi:MAG: hypothetical protein AAFX06_20950 [Planctomycetota bacterium]